MPTTVNLTDDSFRWFLFQLIAHPILMCFSFAFFLFILGIYKERVKIVAAIKLLPIFRKKSIKLPDILNHQLFKDLDFYVKEKIFQAYDPELNTKIDPVKMEIARDFLLIKFQNSLTWLYEFFCKTDFEDPYLNIRSLFIHRYEKNLAIQYSLYKEQGIPPLFIEKFVEVTKPSSDYVLHSIHDLLSEKIPLTIYEKLYMALGNLSSYFSTLLLDMKDVITCINGDLRGQIYNGKIVGGNNYKIYPVPDRSYIPRVEQKLEALCLQLNGCRSSVCVFHDVNKDDYFDGLFSKIYEYENLGFKPAISELQYKSNSLLLEFLPKLKQHEGCKGILTNVNEHLQTIMIHCGVIAFYAYPLFNDNQLKGFLLVTFNNMENYKDLDEEETFEILKNTGFLLNHYITYEKGLNYSGNRLKTIANWESPISGGK